MPLRGIVNYIRGGHMSIGKTRGFLYWLNRLLGDVRPIHDNASLTPLSGLKTYSAIIICY